MDVPFGEDYLHALEEARQTAINTLRTASDWADFKKRCGRIEGLEKAQTIYDEIQKEHLAADEDEDDDD